MKLKSSTDFIIEIETLVKEKRLTFFDAVIHYCESHNIEVETVASLVKQHAPLKAKIQNEAEQLNLVRRSSARLPL
jgi:Phage late-transcription coactivator